MSTKYAYTYTVLRYVHDVTTGEFVNVGVALHAPSAQFLGALCRTTYGRLSNAFPGVNGEHFRSLMRYIQSQFELMSDRVRDQLQLDGANSVLDFATSVLPTDDSSLQWSPEGSGRSDDPAVTLEKLFERMVTRYDDHHVRVQRDDSEVWRHFKRTLETRQLLRYFEPRKVSVADDEIQFEHTWKNGVLHCLEPVSFDLASAESIRDKAHRWLGRIQSVASGSEPFKMYFLVGAPQDDALADAYDNAISILRKTPVDKTIWQESDADQFGQALAAEVEKHHATLG